MKKAVLIPDSFKGTLEAREVCEIMAAVIHKHDPNCVVDAIPIADGGEGTIDSFLAAMGGESVPVVCQGPFGEEMMGRYGLLSDGTAVIEMAVCSGLPLVEGRKDPERTTTYGVGQLLLAAAEAGCRKVLVALGGSCTNDGGCGAAAACGVRFLDEQGCEFIPTGGTLSQIVAIDTSLLSPALRSCEIVTMCDITNPLHGPEGAAYVFAPQKGADASMVERLDAGLRHFDQMLRTHLHSDAAMQAGAGAAGGMGAGMMAFFNSRLCSGIETMLTFTRFAERIADADVIFTGEGRIDSQSVGGKVLSGVAAAAKAQGKTVIALVGADDSDESVYDMGITAVFSINRRAEDLSVSQHKSRGNLAATMDNILRILK